MTRFATLLAAGAALAVAAAAAGDLQRHVNPAGWRVEYPAAWKLERSSQRCRRMIGEATVANFAMRRGITSYRDRASCGFAERAPGNGEGSFPVHGVVLRVTCVSRGLVAAEPPPTWPLTTDQLEPLRPFAALDLLERRHRLVLHHGFLYNVSMWIGAEASEADRRAVERVLTSLRFTKGRPRGLRTCEPK